MKLLLDENLPKELKSDFAEHEVSTVRDNGWSGKLNGELMQLIVENEIDVFLTFDKNIRYQQNFQRYPIRLLILFAKTNEYQVLKELVPNIRRALDENLPIGPTEIKL